MGTVPNLTDETPLDQYTATASQTEFTFTFMIFATSDIKVYVNDVLKTETTDYVVKQADLSAIVPADDLPMDGGKVVFNSGLTVSDAVSISREIPIDRLTGYSVAGAFRANVLNTELTRMQAINQQLERDIARSVRLSPSDAEGGTFTLPSSRASKFLAFDASGNMIASAGTIGTTPITVSSFMATVLDDTTAAAARTTMGLAIGSDVQSWDADLDAFASLVGTADKIPYYTGVGAMALSNLPSNNNLIINGQGLIGQRGTSFTSATTPANSDDTYLLDRMLLLSDGNDIVDVSQETTEVPSGAYSSIKFDVETANKQFAYCQILEAKDAAKIIGGTASLSFKAKKGGSNATLETLRAALVSWNSTGDIVTSDLVTTWNGAGTDPTLATNWTYENTPSNLTLTTSYQTFKIENISIDTASTKNVALFIWLDDTDATVGDLAYIGDIKVEEGSIATPYISDNQTKLVQRCQRYYAKTYNLNVIPGQISTAGRLLATAGRGFTGGASLATSWPFPVIMRTSPSIIFYNSDTGGVGTWRDSGANNYAVGINTVGESIVTIVNTGAVTTHSIGFGHITAEAEL